MEITENKIGKIGLWTAVKGVCCGTEIFKELCNQRLWRVFLHLFLLSGICSLLIMFLGKKNIEAEINPQLEILNEYSGGFDCRTDGIYPKKNADKSFDFKLNNQTKVCYTPNFKDIDFHEILENGMTWFWIPQGVFAVVKFNNATEGSVMFLDFSAFQRIKIPQMEIFKNNKELDTYMKQSMATITPCDYSKIPEIDLDFIRYSHLSSNFLRHWIQYFWQAFFMSLVFAAFYTITGVGKVSNMKFKSFFTISIYAGFPAMLVSVLFEAFKLPFISFSAAFSFGWLIYLLVILNVLVRTDTEKN